jgi:hypothetical protein
MHRLAAALRTIGFLLLVPVLLPIGLVLHGTHRHRVRSAAGRFRCPGCGRVLGREAVRLADVAWDRRMREKREQHPDVRFRVLRDVHAICPACGRRYRFIENGRTFVDAPA